MGDGADLALENVMESMWGDHDDQEPEDYVPPGKRCRNCGQQGLSWQLCEGKWRLFAGREMHRCPVRSLRGSPMGVVSSVLGGKHRSDAPGVIPEGRCNS